MKHTIKGYITYSKDPYATEPEISFYTFNPNPEHWPDLVVVAEHSIEVEVPDNFDPRHGLITNLKEQEKKAMAEFQAKVTAIHKRISELQAIEHVTS